MVHTWDVVRYWCIAKERNTTYIYIFNYIDPSKNDIEKIHAPIQIMITVQIQRYIYNDR